MTKRAAEGWQFYLRSDAKALDEGRPVVRLLNVGRHRSYRDGQARSHGEGSQRMGRAGVEDLKVGAGA